MRIAREALSEAARLTVLIQDRPHGFLQDAGEMNS